MRKCICQHWEFYNRKSAIRVLVTFDKYYCVGKLNAVYIWVYVFATNLLCFIQHV